MSTTRHLNYAKTRFILSAPGISHLPADAGIEVAFVGRSNAGKSSALNALAQQKHLARTSKTPGRTQLINLFEIEPNCRIVDLPGYGYAKVPETMRITWQQLLSEYLQKRKSLAGMVILMDIRHPLKDLDQKMIDWSVAVGLPVMLLLTKADKLARGAQKKQLNMIREAILPFQGDIAVEIFSSLKKIGLSSLTVKLDEWYSAMVPEKTGYKNKK